MMEYQALKNLRVVPAPHEPMNGGSNFSEYGVKSCRDTGYDAMSKYLAVSGLKVITPKAP